MINISEGSFDRDRLLQVITQRLPSSKERQLDKIEKYITIVFLTLELESCLNRLNQAWSNQRQDRNMRSKI